MFYLQYTNTVDKNQMETQSTFVEILQSAVIYTESGLNSDMID